MADEMESWVRAASASRETVEAALRRRDVAPRVRERLEMVKGVALGQPLAAVARWGGRGERTVVRWLRAFAAGGVAALADAPRSGRPVRADAAYLAGRARPARAAQLAGPAGELGPGAHDAGSARGGGPGLHRLAGP